MVRNHPILGGPIIFESGRPFWLAIYGETYRKSLKDLKEHFGPFWAFSRPVFTKKHRFLQILSKFINNSPVVGVGSSPPPEPLKRTGKRQNGPETRNQKFTDFQSGFNLARICKETAKFSLPEWPDLVRLVGRR